MRVLSLNPVTTELMFAIGAGDLLVGRTDDCDYPKTATKVPSIGPMSDVSEVLVEVFEPTLVLVGRGQRQLADDLGEKFRVIYFNPQSLEDMFSGITGLASLLNKQVEADVVVHDIRILLDRLQQKAEKYRDIRVYCEVAHNHTEPATGYVAEIIKLARGVPFTGDVTPENMQDFDPQIIVSAVPDEQEFNFELLTARDGWQSLNAVKYDRLFSISSELLHRPGPRLQEGIKTLAKLLHGVDLSNGNGDGHA